MSCRHVYIYDNIYLLTPWCIVLLEKLIGLKLVKKFPAFHGTRRFITALTSVRQLSSPYTHIQRPELLTQYCADDKIEKNEMGWTCGTYGGGEGVYKVLVGKPEGTSPLGRPRRRWVDNIRMDLRRVGCGYMDWIGLAQDRYSWRTFVSAVMNLRVP